MMSQSSASSWQGVGMQRPHARTRWLLLRKLTAIKLVTSTIWPSLFCILLKALQRIKESPDFWPNALAAYEEYRQQMIDAASAVHAFCELHGKADRMTWRHRPDLEGVGLEPLLG